MEIEMTQPVETPDGKGIYSTLFTAIVAIVVAAAIGTLVVLFYRHQTAPPPKPVSIFGGLPAATDALELPPIWKNAWMMWGVVLVSGYAAVVLLAGGVLLLVRARLAPLWNILHGMLVFVVLGVVSVINLVIIAANVRDLDVDLFYYTLLLGGLAGLGYFVARNAWANRKEFV